MSMSSVLMPSRSFSSGQDGSRSTVRSSFIASGTRPGCDELRHAANDIFKLNGTLLPVVTRLQQSRYRLGILSNTCENHWEYCRQRFRIVGEGFDVHALSFRIGAMKPDAAIFERAAELAGVAPDEVFYVDDIPQHVAAAREVGFDAVQYTSTPALVAELRRRGLRFNY